jgi:peptidoglycan/LPS O-acetylase OafA/YrhL
MTAVFVHGFWPDTITSVVPGGWSVADEVIFYALFPVMVPALLQASWRYLITVMVVAVVLGAQVSRLLDGFSELLPTSAQGVAGEYFSLWFPRQLPCFIFGVALFKFSAEQRKISESLAKCVCVLAVALMFTFPFLEGVKYMLPLGLATSYGIAFSLFAFSLMYWRASPLVGNTVVWIGKVSYSAYFVHFAVLHYLPPLHPTGVPFIDFAFMCAVVIISSVTISSVTYLFIEMPFIRWGGKLIEARWSMPIRQAHPRARLSSLELAIEESRDDVDRAIVGTPDSLKRESPMTSKKAAK